MSVNAQITGFQATGTSQYFVPLLYLLVVTVTFTTHCTQGMPAPELSQNC